MTTLNQRMIFKGGVEISPLLSNEGTKDPNSILLYSNNGKLQTKNSSNETSEIATVAPVLPNIINASTYQINALENTLLVDSSGLTNIVISLPLSNSVTIGKIINIIDYSRTSSTINITVSSDTQIQGDTNILFNIDGMSVTFLFNGNSNWNII